MPPQYLFNAFDDVARAAFPEIRACWDDMRSLGAREIHLCGSGPAIYAAIERKELATTIHLGNGKNQGLAYIHRARRTPPRTPNDERTHSRHGERRAHGENVYNNMVPVVLLPDERPAPRLDRNVRARIADRPHNGNRGGGVSGMGNNRRNNGATVHSPGKRRPERGSGKPQPSLHARNLRRVSGADRAHSHSIQASVDRLGGDRNIRRRHIRLVNPILGDISAAEG